MSEAKSKLLELKEALEKAIKMPSTAPVLPSLKPPKIPTAPKIDTATTPKQPSLAPSSKKDPIKVAQQLQDPHLKASALKIAKNGQWSLENLEKAGTESQYLLLKATFNQLKIRVENELLLKVSKKEMIQRLGGDNKAIEIAEWSSKHANRDDIQNWIVRNYKQDPTFFNKDFKTKVEHYVGMAGVDANSPIAKVRFDKSHGIEDGIKMWEAAEQEHATKVQHKPNFIVPDELTKEFLDAGNGYKWFDLGKGYDEAEGKAMNHCGNVAGQHEPDDRILSLRKVHMVNGKEYHEPVVTTINNNGFIGESKGYGNSKPSSKYHSQLLQLMKDPRIKENVGGGWLPNNNFHSTDLSQEQQVELHKVKPNFERLFGKSEHVDPKTYPSKHAKDAEKHNEAVDLIKLHEKKPIDFNSMKDMNLSDRIKFMNLVANASRFRENPELAKKMIHSVIQHDEPSLPREYHDDGDPNDDDQQLASDTATAIMKSPHLDRSHLLAAKEKSNSNPESSPDDGPDLYGHLLSSHAANKHDISEALNDTRAGVRTAAVQSPHFKSEHMAQALNDSDQDVRTAAVSSPHFKPEHMAQALNDEHESVRQAAAYSPQLKPEHMEQALSDSDQQVRHAAVRSPHFQPEHMAQVLNDESSYVRHAAVRSPQFKSEHMEQALNDESAGVRVAAVDSPHFKPEHMEQALNDNDESASVRRTAVQSPHFKPEHMKQALNDEDAGVRYAAIQSPHFQPEHMKQALNDSDQQVRHAAVGSPHFQPEHMKQVLNDESSYVRHAAVGSPHFKPEHMEQALNDKDESVRYAAVDSPQFKSEHVEQALNNRDEDVRKRAVQSPHFQPEHMEQALDDTHEDVRQAAVRSPHFKPEHVEQALNDSDQDVRYAAVDSPQFKSEHVEQALNNRSSHVRRTAVQSPHFKPEHMKQALNDKDSYVRHAAVRSPHFQPEHMAQALNDTHASVRHAAVDSPHFQPEHMAQALNDEEEIVRRAAIRSPHFKSELVEKGLKSTIAGAVLAGSALLPSKAIAAPIKAPIPVSQVSEVRPDSNTGNMMSTGSKPSPKGGEATIRTSEYGPYKITSSYQPHVEDGNTSQKMTHQVSWNGTPSPKHLAAVSKEYGIDVNNLQSLKANPSHATGLDGKPSGDTYIKSTSKDIHSPSKGQPAGYLHQ